MVIGQDGAFGHAALVAGTRKRPPRRRGPGTRAARSHELADPRSRTSAARTRRVRRCGELLSDSHPHVSARPARVRVAVVRAQAHTEGEASSARVEAIARGVPAGLAGAGRLDRPPAATGLARLELERHPVRAALEAPALEIHGFPQGSTSRRGVEPRTFCAVSRRPSHRSPIRKWFGESPGIGRNRGVFGNGSLGAEKREFAGQKRRTAPNQVLVAMQQVVGSSPISRFEAPANRHLFCTRCRLQTMQKVLGSRPRRMLAKCPVWGALPIRPSTAMASAAIFRGWLTIG
jgi:hypothetical protein